MSRFARALVWFRRDLRNTDHAALYAALRQAGQVHCAFVFDTDILADLTDPYDRRVDFIHASLRELADALAADGGGLIVRHGRAIEEIPRLAAELGVQAVFANRDYEPAAKTRDAKVAAQLQARGIAFFSPKDQAIFDRAEIRTQAGRPFTVFTPYKNAWLKRLAAPGGAFFLRAYPARPATGGRLVPPPPALRHFPELAALGFRPTDLAGIGLAPGMSGARATWRAFCARIDRYAETRDFPAADGTSGLSCALRFGTLSIRELAASAWQRGTPGAMAWLSELVWRDFYFMLLDHFPDSAQHAFRPEARKLVWDDWPAGLDAWQNGRTGYPLVDAAMRQLRQTGQLHNRLRMVVAAFLCKDLGLDWRAGAAHFARHLNDYDLAANTGNWQWSASTGCDAQPWFRIFNPVSQSRKFDPEGRYIRRHLPQLARLPDRYVHTPWSLPETLQHALGCVIGRDYPAPLVDHAQARARSLARFAALKSGEPTG